VGAQEVQTTEARKADEKVLSDRPTDLCRNNHTDESVGGNAHGGFVADSMFQVKTSVAVQP
jgi:hypothetical protein